MGGGFDAGIRFAESIPEDMVGVRIGAPCRMVVVGAPSYFERHPKPRHPDDLALHDCIRYRFPSGRLYKWEFRKGDVKFDLDVKGRVTLGDQGLTTRAALDGVGLGAVIEDYVTGHIAAGRLIPVLDDWCPSFPGFMLY